MWKWILLVLVLIYVFRKWIFMFLMKFLVKKMEKNAQKFAQQMQEQMQNNQQNNQYQQGEFSFNIPNNQGKKKKENLNNDNDFVDFEEVK